MTQLYELITKGCFCGIIQHVCVCVCVCGTAASSVKQEHTSSFTRIEITGFVGVVTV